MVDEHDLLQHNIGMLDGNDVIAASYLGSGSSLLGGLLIELGINYIEGYQERIDGRSDNTTVANEYWREHWPQLDTKYTSAKVDSRAIRVVKAHYYPESFANSAVSKAVLLMRDGRDAVISYYNWRRGFSDETGTLHDFLERDGYYGKKPFADWAFYHKCWVEWGQSNQLHIIRYEDLKFAPVPTIQRLLAFLGQARSVADIVAAVDKSRFQTIRKQEDDIVGNKTDARIFRKGLVGEWRSTLDARALATLTPETQELLERLGYASLPDVNGASTLIGVTSDTLTQAKINPNAHFNVIDRDAEKVTGARRQLQSDICSLKGIVDDFKVEYMDRYIVGPVYCAVSEFEIIRAVQHMCQCKGYDFHLLQNNCKASA